MSNNELIDDYLIWSNEHKAWWRKNSAGYTFHIEAAGRYSREKAISICGDANKCFLRGKNPNEIPVSYEDAKQCMLSEERTRHDY